MALQAKAFQRSCPDGTLGMISDLGIHNTLVQFGADGPFRSYDRNGPPRPRSIAWAWNTSGPSGLNPYRYGN